MRDEFDEWFSGSKVVEDDGTPKVLYHGGQKGITQFGAHVSQEKSVLEKSDAWHYVSAEERYFLDHPVFFFTESPGVAEGYRSYNVDYDDSEVYEVYLALRRPLDVSAGSPEALKALAQVLDETLNLPAWATNGSEREIKRDIRLAIASIVANRQADVMRAARAAGYDGLITPDTDVRGRGPYTSYVAFDADQVRFANPAPSTAAAPSRSAVPTVG